MSPEQAERVADALRADPQRSAAAVLVVRPIRPDEWQPYRDIRLRALQDAPDAFGSTYDIERERTDDLWASRLRAASASGMDLPLFAIDGDTLCGLAWCKISEADARIAHLYQMWVAPESRGQGAGGALLDEAIAFARRAGARVVCLGVTVADSPAMRLYRSRGFVAAGAPVPLREGSALQAQNMHLTLDGASVR